MKNTSSNGINLLDRSINRALASSYSAVAMTLAALIAVVVLYVVIHVVKERPEEQPWDDAIQIVGFFEIRPDDAVLTRFFADKDLREFLDGLRQRAEKDRKTQLASRHYLLRDITGFCQKNYSNTRPVPQVPNTRITPRHSLPEPINGPGLIGQAISHARGDGTSAFVITDEMAMRSDLGKLAAWLQARPESDHTSAGQSGLDPKSYAQCLLDQIALEKELTENLTSQVSMLEPPIDFGWLYHEGAGWAFEVFVWSLIGVMINSVVGAIAAARAGVYKAGEFIRVVPKIVIAPILAFITVAILSSGLVTNGIYSYNLPYFLALSFFLGFASERVAALIRNLANTVLGGIAFEPQKLADAAARREYRMRFDYPPAAASDPPQTFSAFRDMLSNEVKRVAEAEIVRKVESGQINPENMKG
ncbi:hypothetical protein [Algisphaera agarilytica]|uniref:Uncharacterized protein n=1 Tax=Algisphaera agarilytica TaxID=1385975 RepID=A0A7X0H7K8_9BACT|nr:hypothetical protein [Algisphaera agarilytica]MBB6429280.1 hypothetical protein [Algisphaera agarilytica]